MIIGCVRELKNNEYRVGLTPDNVRSYVAAGHEVLVEAGAGIGSGFDNDEYKASYNPSRRFSFILTCHFLIKPFY